MTRTFRRIAPCFLAVLAYLVLAAPASAQRRAARPEAAEAPDPDAGDDEREKKVMERFLGVLEKAPRRGTALDRVYGYYVERGLLDDLLKTYQDRIAKDPKDGAAWLLIGLFESQRGRDSEAVKALRKAEETRPDDPQPSYCLGQALVLVGQPDAAAEAFERAIARKPPRADVLEIYQALGRVYQRARRNEKALAVWERLEKQFPDDLRVQEQIASALAEESEPEKALSRYEALAKKTTDKYRQTQYRLDAAELKVRLGKTPDALKDFESLLNQLNPESWLYKEVRRKIEEVFLKTDDQTGLTAYYEKWIEKNPDDVEAMARLGRALAGQGKLADARTWFDRAVKRAPSKKELRIALIDQLVQEGRIADAAAQYEALAKTDPNNPDLLREWGRLLLKDQAKPEPERKKAAGAIWRRLVENRPKDPAVAVQAADLFRAAEMPDDAIALYRKAIELAPDSPQYYEYLGDYYHNLRRSPEALATWSKIAEGPNRNAKNLGRLSEVLAGFGYKKEAVEPAAQACKLASDDFDLRMKYADLLLGQENYLEGLAQLENADKIATDPEQHAAVLAAQVKAYQGSNTLPAQIASLQKSLKAGKGLTAARWLRLARLLEADGKLPEATAAAEEALALDPKSALAWAAAARIREASGNLGAAADAYRKLAEFDRRARTEYLTEIAKLEARLGRREQALKAGRDLLAAAPGNPDSYQFFADLCFQLGNNDEGFEALRRAVRVNPTDSKAMLTLADTLANQFRTEEAIELFWRAFDKASDLEARLGIVAKLTNLYLQRSQFDRLVARLERESREANQQREMTICLAQAYSASGDYGTARQALERLLGSNARDTGLLGQLSALAEAEGDVQAAAKYQKQLLDISPSEEGSTRLAQLYVRSGDLKEAEALWTSLASKDQEPHRILQAADSLLSHAKYEGALSITERLLRKDPNNWEALYREGVALANSADRRAEAERRFRAILALKVEDDAESVLVKARKNKTGRAVGRALIAQAQTIPILTRLGEAWQVRAACGLENRYNYGSSVNSFAPTDHGAARMAAEGFLYALAQKAGKGEDYLKARKSDHEKAGRDPREAWDHFYLQSVRQEPREAYEAAKVLAHIAPTDPSALFVFLQSLSSRAATSGVQVYRSSPAPAEDRTSPLPAPELTFVVDSYRTLRQRRPEWIESIVLSNVATELKRAKKTEEADRFYRETVAEANGLNSVGNVLTLAAARGDLDGTLALFDKYETLQGGKPVAGASTSSPPDALGRLMNARAKEKAFGDITRILDHYLAAYRKRAVVPGKSKKALYSSPYGGSYFPIWVGANQTYTSLDYPQPGEYYDYGGILLLRSAFEHFKRADLLSDLSSHFRAQLAKAEGKDRVYPQLALAYLSYWSDDRDAAVEQLAAAAESVPGDVEMKLDLANMREKRGERDEALALADAIDPLDNATMQKRETLALRVAVATGDVDRARLAAERLFNLRLDTDTQVALAGQMHQLGMHEMGEAVMARARRRAGNKTATLVGLMNQYQRQNQMDTAIQVAHQILRKSTPKAANPNGDQQEDGARREAVQTLARSGKIKELIERAEAQLKASPNSTQLLQTLADYYRAANDPAKMKATYKKIADLHPDDAKLRYQVAQQLYEAGDAAGAIEHYKVAIRKEPQLFANRYWEVQNAFQQAGKLDELTTLFDGMDLKAIGQSYTVMNIVANLLQDEKSRDKGLALFRKAWAAYPAERAQLMSNIYNEEIWKLPEMYEYAREAALPSPTATNFSNWSGVDSIMSYNSDGKVNGTLSRLLNAATAQGKLDALTGEIEEKLRATPGWSGGKALLAVIRARQNRTDEAKALLKPLLDNAKEEPIPAEAAWLIGQELEDYEPLRPLAIALYEGTGNETNPGGIRNQFQYSPARRLVELYRKEGRNELARKLVLDYASKKAVDPGYNPGYASSQNVEQALSCGAMLTSLGYPADAVRLYTDLLSDPETLQDAAQWNGNQDYHTQQARAGLKAAMDGLTGDKTIASTLRTLRSPRANPRPGAPVLDLVLVVNPRELEHAAVTSLFAEALGGPRTKPEMVAETRADLAKLVESHPKDVTVLVASALAAIAEGKAETIAETMGRVVKWAEESPLEDLSAGARANARQRAEASHRMALWLVARECWKRDSLRSAGDSLAAQALEAARRQTDPFWALAMLRERGQVALDRGDKTAAERAWTEMLDMVLANPLSPKKPATAPPAVVPAPSSPKADNSAKRETRTVSLREGEGAKARTPAGDKDKGPRVLPTPIDKFDQAIQISKLAARKGMPALSIRAVRQALAGGPPVAVSPSERFGRGQAMSIRTTQVGGEANDPTARQVQMRLFEAEAAWKKAKIDPKAVYEALRDAVLPDARPGEVFLYTVTFSANASRLPTPLSVGGLLAKYAVKAAAVDDLRGRIDARKGQPLAELPATVLTGQLNLENKDADGVLATLKALDDRLARDSLRTTGELACYVSLPAMADAKTETKARAVTEKAVKNLQASTNEIDGVLSSLVFALARHDLDRKDLPSAKAQLQEYVRIAEQGYRGNAEYSSYQKRAAYGRVAGELIRAGLLAEAMDMMGRFADTPVTQYGDPGAGNILPSLFRMLRDRPAAERYATLRAWTLPEANRKSVRLVASFVPESAPPKVFGEIPPLAPPAVSDGGDGAGVRSSFGLLIAAAREAGKLDELSKDARAASEQKVENGDALYVLVRIARRDASEVEPAVKATADELAASVKPQEANPAPTPRRTIRRNTLGDHEWTDYLIARASAADPKLSALGDAMLNDVYKKAQNAQHAGFKTHLVRDMAVRSLERSGAAASALPADPGLALWHPTTTTGAANEFSGTVPASWVENEGLVNHATGSSDDYLLFNSPLSGTFEFSVDAYDGGWTESHLSYGGLIYEPMATGMQGAVRTIGWGDNLTLNTRTVGRELFNRLTVQVSPQKVRMLVNGHLFHEEASPSPTSPWLALYTRDERRSAWKNFKITGTPTVPRQVALVSGDRFEGWSARMGESVPQRLMAEENKRTGKNVPAAARSVGNLGRAADETSEPQSDWSAKDGVLSGRRAEASAESASGADPAPSLLSYLRPLRDGDAVSYEFLFEPDETLAHPALGRTVFLLAPDGLRLRWVTANAETEWTGMAVDNATKVPGADGPLSLEAGAWNKARLSIKGDVATLEINGKTVAESPVPVDHLTHFGLYHDKNRTAAKVRNVVLTGNWPESLSADRMANLLARADDKRTTAGRHRSADLIGDRYAASRAEEVVREAEGLPKEERYAYLKDWVLPSETHAGLRLYGYYTATNPPPTDAEKGLPARTDLGGDLAAPALRLVSVAGDAGMLGELAEAVASIQPADARRTRDRLAMLALIHGAQGKDAEAKADLLALRRLLAKMTPAQPTTDRWAELVAATDSLRRPALRAASYDLLNFMVEQQIQRNSQWHELSEKVRHSLALARLAALPEPPRGDPKSANWARVTHSTAQTRADGHPRATWTIANGEAKHYPGHNNDYLYFNVPLRGDFEVECDLTSFGWREARLAYAGRMTQVMYDQKRYDLWQDDRQTGSGMIVPPLPSPRDYYPFKIVVKNGIYSTYAEGRKLTEERLPAGSDPWLAVYQRNSLTGGARNLRITGKPEIPDALNLSALPDLSGWLADYYGEKLQGTVKDWEKRGEEIVGRRTGDAPLPVSDRYSSYNGQQPQAPIDILGSKQESVLQYNRPMLEDGEISYEFFYEPGKTIVHPALDRLTFLLDPKGVKLHWMTDTPRDRQVLPPDNATAEPSSRKGPESLPLKPGDWNAMKLAIQRDTVSLTLNGEVVFERPIEPINQRNFGLFHYADETEARVRKVIYRGDWPKTLPETHDLAPTARK